MAESELFNRIYGHNYKPVAINVVVLLMSVRSTMDDQRRLRFNS
jgi:hypothetical protein